ncbi:MAG: dihydrofolate reductase family protein [Cyanobacteriota bacterium]|nr:dihydrofolate reductase family protein [Cyanobacteriota bacterium]
MAQPRLRLVLAISLDGRLAPPEGGAAQLGGAADRRVLEEALTWADAVLVGAHTVRAHRCTCLIHAPDLLRQRLDTGRPLQPPVVVWSRSGDIAAELPFFQQPLARWLLLADAARPKPVPGFERVLPFVHWRQALEALGALGVARVVALGGAQLAGSLARAGVLDELQLTVCPVLLGGPHVWLPLHGEGDAKTHWVAREQSPLSGGELLLHYVRQERTEVSDAAASVPSG